MSLPITISIANPDPSDAPTTFTELVALLRTLITAVVTGTYIPYVQGSSTPGVNDEDKVWHRKDGSGRPMGTYVYYSGGWRRQATHRLNEVVMYRGAPADDFDGTGLGIVGGEWDGFALMNGNNGTVDWSDKFMIASHMTDMAIGYSGGQHSTNVSGSTTQFGGVATVTLNDDNTYRPARAALQVRKWTADGNTPNAGGTLYGSSTPDLTLMDADAGNESPDAIATLPPYLATAYTQWVGYS